jgi:hypothetical protein
MDFEVIRAAAMATGKSINTILEEIAKPSELPPLAGSSLEPLVDDDDDEEEEENSESYIVIGKARGIPGEVVTIEVLGKTHLPVNGFGLAVGCDRSLSLTSSRVSPELSEILGLDDPQKIVKEHDGTSWKNTFLQVAVIFFASFFSQEEIEAPIPTEKPPKPPRRTILDLQLSTMIPIFNFDLKIPDDAPIGRKYVLTAEHKYGHRFKYSDGRTRWILYPTEFTTSLKVARFAIRPKFVSGWIDVV